METRAFTLAENIIRGDHQLVLENLLAHESASSLHVELNKLWDGKSILYIAIERWLELPNRTIKTDAMVECMVMIIRTLVAFGAEDSNAKNLLYHDGSLTAYDRLVCDRIISDFLQLSNSRIPLFNAVSSLWTSLTPNPIQLERYYNVAFTNIILPKRDAKIAPWQALADLVKKTPKPDGTFYSTPVRSLSRRGSEPPANRLTSNNQTQPALTGNIACSSTQFTLTSKLHTYRRSSQPAAPLAKPSTLTNK